MAKKEYLLVEPILFYLYNGEGTLNKRTTKIMSPFNKIIKGPETKFLPTIKEQKFVVFEGGIYNCESSEEASWLRFYNNRGGILEINGENIKFKGNSINQVKEEAPKKKTETITEYEKINIAQIPRIVAEGMTPEQLKKLCKTWEIPTDKETVKSEDYIKLLDESGKLS